MSTYKQTYLQYSQNNTPLRDKISNRYLDVIRRTHLMYDTIASDVKKQFRAERNNIAAQAAISKRNTESALNQKGISKSGESVQSSIMGDMVYMGALTDLAQKEASKLSEVSAARQAAVSSIHNDMINAQNEAERQQEEMEYKKERDAVTDEKWEKQFNYNASRDTTADQKWQVEQERQEKRDREDDRRWNTQYVYNAQRDLVQDAQKQREFDREIYESDRDYAFEREKFESDAAQIQIENDLARQQLLQNANKNNSDTYIKNQYLELEKEKQKYDMTNNSQKTTFSQTKSEMERMGLFYTVDEEGFIVPNQSPDEFIDIMIKGTGNGTYNNMEFISPQTLETRMRRTLDNQNINPDYRNALAIYARARGIIS